jgi:hypothetical protein
VRLARLRERLAAADETETDLISGAFEGMLDFHGARVFGQPVVAGRIPPPEWHPKDGQEFRATIGEALQFLKDAMGSHTHGVVAKAKRALVGAVEYLTRNGLLEDIRAVVSAQDLDEDTRARLAGHLKEFLFRGNHPDFGKVPDDYLARVSRWIAELQPTSLHGRLVEEVGQSPWGQVILDARRNGRPHFARSRKKSYKTQPC